MLYVITTFKAYDAHVEALRQNLQGVQARCELSWLVSSPDPEVGRRLADYPWCRTTIRTDRSFGEGWNNALVPLRETTPGRGDWAIFLGAGDTIEALPALDTLEPDTVHCGVTRRVDADRKLRKLVQPQVIPALFWLRIGAWTPACVFPATTLSGFSFRGELRIGADNALFLQARALGYRFRNRSDIVIDMEEGGNSGDPRRGLPDYAELLRTYGVGFPLLQLGHALRWLRSSSIFR